jgi:preprotein translocase subunit SecG
MKERILSWTLRIVAAAILAQTLFFKFTAAPESVELFTRLGMEPNGRILIGIMELITVILLLIPKTAGLGGLIGAGIMAGALMGHLTKLGFSGPMFSLAMLAILVLACCIGVVYLHRDQIPFIGRKLSSPSANAESPPQ